MIVVLGPEEIAGALAEAHPHELVVGAREDARLAAPAWDAAEIAAMLPLPARACVTTIPAGAAAAEVVEAVRRAGGSLSDARVVVLGEPPEGTTLRDWRASVEGAGAVPARDLGQAVTALGRDQDEDAAAAGERPERPGAPQAAAWRDALRASRTRRTLLRRRRPRVDTRAVEGSLDRLIARPLAAGCHVVAVVSPKGGVGKTFLAFLLGSTLARVRRSRILVVDTNPDFGTLADLVGERVPATISDLLRDAHLLRTDEEVAAYTTVTRTGMHILAAPQDPLEMQRLGREGYRAVSDLIAEHYDIVVFDCGTGFLDDITRFAVSRADHVVLVSAPQLVTSKIIMGAADHLRAESFDVRRTTLALNMVRGDEPLNRARLLTALVGRVGGLVEVPFDRRLQRALDLGEFDDTRMSAGTRQSCKRLAAELVSRLRGPEDPERAPADAAAEAELAAPPGAGEEPAAAPVPSQEAAMAEVDVDWGELPETDLRGDGDHVGSPPPAAGPPAGAPGADGAAAAADVPRPASALSTGTDDQARDQARDQAHDQAPAAPAPAAAAVGEPTAEPAGESTALSWAWNRPPEPPPAAGGRSDDPPG